MIVRILTEGQYELDAAHRDRLNSIDNQLVAIVEGNDEAAFDKTFQDLLTFVRSQGRRLADSELAPSDVVLPAPDSTFAEIKDLFVGEGLVPD